MIHHLLSRQLKKLGLLDCSGGPSEDQWTRLKQIVSRTYSQADEDRERLERSLDVSSREMHERTQEIRYQAFHDKLTGLANRALFLDRCGNALGKLQRNGMGVATIFIDLDNFKLINDSLGHDAGDELLKSVANRICEVVRPGDTVARLGGDEFTVLLEDLQSVEEADETARRILSQLLIPVSVSNSEAFASASIGIAFTKTSSEEPATLIRNADTAMYHAKSNGKTGVAIYDESMYDHALDRLELETALRRALDQNEIFVYYQPLVNLETGDLLGAEALARWTHPVRGPVSPHQFIPIAEDTGLIIPIGYWILEQACRQMKFWQAQLQKDLCVSVNLSGKQLQRADVVDQVDAILKSSRLDPAFLKLEITESTMMADRQDVTQKMKALKKLGVKLALDDFGTGYSSLSTLSTFPIDTLKIDQSFVSRIESEPGACAIVEAIIALSKTMKMDVTGEGVENSAQHHIIHEMGCLTGQGYLFGKPLPAEVFSQYLAEGTWSARKAA